jgi:hypothetical protein
MTTRNPLQLIKEAKQIAREHGLRLVEIPTAGGIDYVIYRHLPHGGDTRIGKRSSPEGIRNFVAKCANFR